MRTRTIYAAAALVGVMDSPQAAPAAVSTLTVTASAPIQGRGGRAGGQERGGQEAEAGPQPYHSVVPAEAMTFFNRNAFPTPTLFLADHIRQRMAPSGSVYRITSAQRNILNSVLSDDRLLRLGS